MYKRALCRVLLYLSSSLHLCHLHETSTDKDLCLNNFIYNYVSNFASVALDASTPALSTTLIASEIQKVTSAPTSGLVLLGRLTMLLMLQRRRQRGLIVSHRASSGCPCQWSGLLSAKFSINYSRPQRFLITGNSRLLLLISLLYFLSEVLEKLVFDQIVTYVKSDRLMDKKQSGYKRGRNTQTAFWRLTANVRMGKDKKLRTAMVMFNFSSAFDTVCRVRLLRKL